MFRKSVWNITARGARYAQITSTEFTIGAVLPDGRANARSSLYGGPKLVGGTEHMKGDWLIWPPGVEYAVGLHAADFPAWLRNN